jgi:hypothetical protein
MLRYVDMHMEKNLLLRGVAWTLASTGSTKSDKKLEINCAADGRQSFRAGDSMIANTTQKRKTRAGNSSSGAAWQYTFVLGEACASSRSRAARLCSTTKSN